MITQIIACQDRAVSGKDTKVLVRFPGRSAGTVYRDQSLSAPAGCEFERVISSTFEVLLLQGLSPRELTLKSVWTLLQPYEIAHPQNPI